MSDSMPAAPPHYSPPGWFTTNVFNRVVDLLMRLGVSVRGSRILRVRGRKSGRPYTTPVNLLTIDGTRYLVSPRGNTQWARNLRAAGGGELMLGRRVDRFQAEEVPEADRIPILRAYLRLWKMEVGTFFGGVDADSPDSEFARIAPRHPVFVIR
ncbi:MAG TPA: nitroreductase family deazaflavin-dependent oxidoreductase [Candidatus Dormibacteraeota bacterium]|nr:nitroreductase family deazaflavin-dependent oxidoreductase [Candidatus Dormibacteraeota bacterium]